MRNYLPFDHVDLPRAIQSHPAAHARELELQHRIIAERSRQGHLSVRIRRELAYYPWMVSAIYANTPKVLPEEDLTEILRDPLVRFAVIVEGWKSFGQKLEPTLYDDPESVERLVNYLRHKNQNGLLPLPNYLLHLQKDPNRWARVANEIDPEERRRKLNEVRESAIRHQKERASSAYFVLASTKDAKSVDADYCRLMATEPEYAYLSALLLQSRGAQPQAWQGILAGIKCPRWSFHILRAKLAADRRPFLSNLTGNPPWLVEFFAHRLASDFNELTTLYKECAVKCQGHEMMSDMHNWVRTQSHLSVPESVVEQADHLAAV